MGRYVRGGDLDIWTEQAGKGPDVLLIGGLGDTIESWQFQLDGLADRYRITAFDNRGAGRTEMPDGPATVEMMADDAAAVLRALDIPSAHAAGFSGGSVICQELALRHPDLVRSLVLQSTWGQMDLYLRRWVKFIRWLAGAAPSERDFLEDFFLVIYTARAHNDGTVDAIIEGALEFPYKQAPEVTQRTLDAFAVHRTIDRLHQITAPTLVLAGGIDPTAHQSLGRAVADAIPGAVFEIEECESHEPLQEIPDWWNARVDAFWQEVELRARSAPRPRSAPDDERVATPAERSAT
jgi:pimeloyl-ACP methyl ester carboxylesterase